jgi:hypothetical protein
MSTSVPDSRTYTTPTGSSAIVETIAEDPVAAGQRFAGWAICCCCCGKALTNDLLEAYGIGPECHKGLSTELLANYFRPEVGRVRTARLGYSAGVKVLRPSFYASNQIIRATQKATATTLFLIPIVLYRLRVYKPPKLCLNASKMAIFC